MAIRRVILDVEAPGERLDRFLAAGAGISRGEARRALDRGAVYLDGKRCRIASRLLAPGQRVEVVLEEAGRTTAGEGPPPAILHEDALVLAVDKPPGMPSQATPLGDVGTLPWHVARHLGRRTAEVATVHRLDRETSGVVVFGKTAAATRALAAAFREGTARKEYLAVVAGALRGEGVIDGALAPDPARRGSFRVAPGGVPALTRYRVQEHGDAATVVQLLPGTGRTHQLRVHLASLGHPILGDARYGGPRRAGEIEAPRLLLHARRLELPHPAGGTLAVEAPVPPDLAGAIGHFFA